MEEAAERIRSHTSLLQLTQEKQQMELSHKRARIELEKEANSSSRDLQVSDGLLRKASLLLRLGDLKKTNLNLATAWQCVTIHDMVLFYISDHCKCM